MQLLVKENIKDQISRLDGMPNENSYIYLSEVQ